MANFMLTEYLPNMGFLTSGMTDASYCNMAIPHRIAQASPWNFFVVITSRCLNGQPYHQTDMNCIENLWAHLSRALRLHIPRSQTQMGHSMVGKLLFGDNF